MKRLLLLCVLFAGAALAANPPAYITAGEIRCGATRRGEDVQIWCYTGLVFSVDTFVSNSLYRLHVWGVINKKIDHNGDLMEWTFTRGSDDVMHYSGYSNGVAVTPGEL